MASADTTANENQVSDQKSNANKNKQQDQADSGTDHPRQINGKPVIATKITGKVKWFNVRSCYGFITRSDIEEDIFVHKTAIIKNNPQYELVSVGDGEMVEFDIVEGEKGYEAANVTGPNGANVHGSKFAADRQQYDTYGNIRRGRRRGRFPFRGRGGFFRDDPHGYDPGFGPRFDNYGQPPPLPPPIIGGSPFGRPPRGFGDPMFRNRGRPPFGNGYEFHGNFPGRGPRTFHGPGGPMMGGPLGPMPGRMDSPFNNGFRGRGGGRGYIRGRGRGRVRFFRGPRYGNHPGRPYNANNGEYQSDGRIPNQSSF